MRVKKGNVERIIDEKSFSYYKKLGYKRIDGSLVEEELKDEKSMTVKELRALAKEKGIEGYSSLNKEELIAALGDVE